MSIAVVTDSTAYLPDGFAARHGIRVVPLHVLIDGVSALDGIAVNANVLTRALRRHQIVTTSRPTPHEFAQEFREALQAGAEAVVSVHLSQEISGTWEAAVLAAQEVGEDRVRVVDSQTTAMGLGFAVLSAVTAAAGGATAEGVERAAVVAAAHSDTFFMVENLDYLRRSGRVGAAGALVGTALSMKPLLGMKDGLIRPIEKVRTTSRAMARLVELAVESAAGREVEMAVHHLAAPGRAAELAARLTEQISCPTGCVVSEVGAVIGAHTGPGVLGVVIQRSS